MTGAQITKIVQDYLSHQALSKVACLTNILPRAHDPIITGLCVNYICFCVPNQARRAEALFLAYLYGLRNLDYDVMIGCPEECLKKRQFGYLDLQFDEVSRVNEVLEFVIENKKRINRQHSILVRFRCADLSNVALSSKAAIRVCKKEGDTILEIA